MLAKMQYNFRYESSCDDLEKSKIIYSDQIYTVAKESCHKKSNDHKYLQEQLKVKGV